MDEDSAIAQHERRLAAALDRIGRVLDRADEARAAAPPPPAARRGAAPAAASGTDAAEIARLREALEVERAAVAQLNERLKVLKEREGQTRSQTGSRIETMTRQLDLQGLELMRARKLIVQLRETLRTMTEAAIAGTPEPHLINRAMLAELEALRAQRQLESAEMDEILTALAPLIEEAEQDART